MKHKITQHKHRVGKKIKYDNRRTRKQKRRERQKKREKKLRDSKV